MLDEDRARRAPVAKNTDIARTVVTDKVRETKGRMSAKRLLPVARAAGYTGSPRNFRRLVAEVKKVFRAGQGRHQRRPAVWSPGETVVIDWGTLPGTGRHVFCAVLAWLRFRFVRCLRSVLDMRRHRFVGEFLDEVAFPVLAYPFGEQAVEGGVDRRIGNTADVFGLDLDDTSAITNRRLGSWRNCCAPDVGSRCCEALRDGLGLQVGSLVGFARRHPLRDAQTNATHRASDSP